MIFFLVVRNPPYEYAWTWQTALNNPDVRRSASTDGVISLSIFSRLDAASSAEARGHVGIYFRPTASGMYSFSVSPSVSAHYGQGGTFGSALTGERTGIFGMKYNVSNGAYEGVIFDVSSSWFGLDTWWLGGSAFNSYNNSGLSLGATFQADTNHYYSLCVYCVNSVRADGFGPLSGAIGHSWVDVSVPYMAWYQLK